MIKIFAVWIIVLQLFAYVKTGQIEFFLEIFFVLKLYINRVIKQNSKSIFISFYFGSLKTMTNSVTMSSPSNHYKGSSLHGKNGRFQVWSRNCECWTWNMLSYQRTRKLSSSTRVLSKGVMDYEFITTVKRNRNPYTSQSTNPSLGNGGVAPQGWNQLYADCRNNPCLFHTRIIN